MVAILLFNTILNLPDVPSYTRGQFPLITMQIFLCRPFTIPSSTYYKRSTVVKVIPADNTSSWNSSSALHPDYLVLTGADPSVAAHRVVDTTYARLPDHDAWQAPATPRSFAPSAPPPPN